MGNIKYKRQMQSILNVIMGFLGVSRTSYEAAPYQVIRTDGDFEVREYPDINLVSINSENGNQGFRDLFNYISGDNEMNEKIPMTVPVYMQDVDNMEKMAFVMPADMVDVPAPTNPEVYG